MTLSDWRRQIDETIATRRAAQSAFPLRPRNRQNQASRNLPLYQPEREREVLENAERVNSGPLTDAPFAALFERIIDEARSAERKAMHR